MKRKWIQSILLLGFGIFLFGYGSMEKKESFCLEAHRGRSELYPENTLIAFEEAGKCKAFSAIETDVQETSDGELVLMHDRKIDRTTNGTGKVSDYSFAELREFKIDGGNNVDQYSDEKIPTLKEFLQICRKYGKIPYIEMKTMTTDGIKKLIRILEENGWRENCVLTTFRYENLDRVRQITADYPVQYMVPEEFELEQVLEQLSVYENVVFRPSAYSVTSDMVELCKEKGIGVECYGLQTGDREKYVQLQEMGVLGGTCNDWQGLH